MSVQDKRHIFKTSKSHSIGISKDEHKELGIDSAAYLMKTNDQTDDQAVDDFAKKFIAEHQPAFDVLKGM